MENNKQGEYNKKYYAKKALDEDWKESRRVKSKSYWERHPEKYTEHKIKMKEKQRLQREALKRLTEKYEKDTPDSQ